MLRRVSAALLVLVTTAFGVAIGLRARGAGAEAPVRIEMSAHDGCPKSDDFYDEVRARTSHVRRATDGERAWTLRVVITRSNAQDVGVITIVDETGATSERTVSSKSCGEVTAALAFIAALSIDSAVATNPPSTSASVTPSASSSMSATSSAAPEASVDAPEPAVAASAPALDRLRLSAGIGFELAFAQSPNLVAGTSVHVAVETDRHAFVAPALRLGVARRSGGLLTTELGHARFSWTIAELDVCPLRFSFTPAFSLRPCAGVEAGTLEGAGEAIATAHDVTRPWLAGRGFVRIELRALDVLVFAVHFGVTVPFTRDQFLFDPGNHPTNVYRAPEIVPIGGISLGVLFL